MQDLYKVFDASSRKAPTLARETTLTIMLCGKLARDSSELLTRLLLSDAHRLLWGRGCKLIWARDAQKTTSTARTCWTP
jgi:hypothetical protein